MEKKAVITGATSGIGKATALLLAENGWNVAITGRRRDRLDTLADQIKHTYGVESIPLCFDIRDEGACKEAVSSLPETWSGVNLLVNNAGLAAGQETIDEGKTTNWERMIDTNIKGLLYITHCLLPALKRCRGHIINIGSTAGKEAYEKGNVYCATKFAVDALTKSMRIDLLKHGVKVSSICPGAAETEFSLVRFDGDEQKASDVYKGFTPLSAEDIAEVILFCATRPPNVNINDVVLTATAQANSFYINRNET
ncbi:MAG: SDR family NAD(P)-dependent oxidoreductase [Flavobacteriales bacterium]